MKTFFKKLVVAILTWQARAILRKYKPKIVAVTGNVGKTSTRAATVAAVSSSFSVRASPKSYNSLIGLPLAILGETSGFNNPLKWLSVFISGFWQILFKHPYPQVLVLEVGADRPADIKRIVQWLRPEVGVVTSLGTTPVHVEFFPSAEALIEEKSQLVKFLKENGTAVLLADDSRVAQMSSLHCGRVITYGLNQSDVRGWPEKIIYQNKKPSGISFEVEFGGKRETIEIKGVLGRSHVLSALAGLAAARALGIDFNSSLKGLSKYKPEAGRLTIIPGIKDSIIVDDTYNSSPAAASLALKTLASVETSGPSTKRGAGRKIAVLGDMMELGKFTQEEHEKLGRQAAGLVDELLTVGRRAEFIAQAAQAAGLALEHIYTFDDSRECGRYLQNFIRPGDVILIKGSQAVRLERAVAEIMREPQRKRDLLVRQGPEWQ